MKLFLFIGIFIILSIYSCTKEYAIPPELPPVSSFITDFSDFNNNKAEGDSLNWKFAAENVGVWNTLITIGLAIPMASYIEALNNHTPVYQSDNTWLWEYSFTDLSNNSYTAKLYGILNNETADWEVYISKEETYLNFLWYTGTGLTDGSKINWVLYDNPNNATELLSIEYNADSDNTGNIKYTNIVPGGAKNGGYIMYGNNRENIFNTFYLIYNKDLDNLTEIEWDLNLKNGRVKDENKFKNSDWHCWDEQLKDIDCK